MAKLRRKPRFRLECGHLSYAVVKRVMEAMPGTMAWCEQCQTWRGPKQEGAPLW